MCPPPTMMASKLPSLLLNRRRPRDRARTRLARASNIGMGFSTHPRPFFHGQNYFCTPAFFFDASNTIGEEKEKNDGDDVFWDASDKKSKEWQELVRMGYRQQSSKKKAPKFFFMSPKKGTRGGIEAEKMQLTRVKSRERRRDFNFVLEGEVVNRCKNIGKKWQRRVLRQKLEERAKQLVRRWITRTRWQRNSFLKNLQHQQGGCVRRWATREEEATAEQVFFPYPEV